MSRLRLWVIVVVLAIYVMTWTAAVVRNNYDGLTQITPVMVLALGALLGINNRPPNGHDET